MPIQNSVCGADEDEYDQAVANAVVVKLFRMTVMVHIDRADAGEQ